MESVPVLTSLSKTQIALEYVYQRASESDCNIFWVQGSGVPKFSSGFKTIARRFRIPLDSAETDEARLLEVKKWFEGRESGSWILVIDNADNEADFAANDSPISKFIPQANDGTLIFTTRSRVVASDQCSETIEVGGMDEKEALELFSKRYCGWHGLGDKEKEDVARILNSVHHLPLAVIGSVKHMTKTANLPSAYWNILCQNEEQMKHLLSRPFYDVQREAPNESILSTFFATFTQIKQQMPLAADLLRLMAFFNHQDIPELLIQYGLKEMDNPNDSCAIEKLLGFSLVTMVQCGCMDRAFYNLNRFVQLSLQYHLPRNELDQGRRTAQNVISRLFPQSQPEQQHICPVYIPHARAVIEDSTDPIAEELRMRVGLYLQDIGSYSDAEALLRRRTVPGE